MEEVIAARNSWQGEGQRVKIVLSCADHPDWSDQRVATVASCSEGQVHKWRERWCQTYY